MKFYPAVEAQTIAETLIPKFHRHLVGVRVDYLFCEKTPSRGGKDVWGSMRKVTSLSAYLGAEKRDRERGVNDPFFVMTISQPVWDKLNTKDRTALVDHELCHGFVDVDDEGVSQLTTVGHDVEEFKCIIERHGLWRPNLQEFADTATTSKDKKVKKEVNNEDQGEEESE